MRRSRLVPVCAISWIGFLGARAASGDGEESAEAPFEFRVFEAGGLAGASDFYPDRGPFSVCPDQVNDDEAPLFGGESEEARKPYGSIDEVIVLLTDSLRPLFDDERVAVAASDGWHIGLWAPAATHARFAEALAGLEASALGTVAVDVAVVEDAPGTASEGPAAPGTAPAWGSVVVAARATGLAGQRFTARAGGQQAFLVDQSVEVATKANTENPAVGVQPDGLSFRASAVPSGNGILLDVQAWFARPLAQRRLESTSREGVELPREEGRRAEGTLRVAPGRWTVLDRQGDVAFWVRAAVRPFAAQAVSTPALPSLRAGGEIGRLTTARLDVRDLVSAPVHVRGETIHLQPSGFNSPEPPELCDPAPRISAAHLVEWVKQAVNSASWEMEGVALDVRHGHLLVRHDERHVAAVARLLDFARDRLLRSVTLRAQVVAVPGAGGADLVAGSNSPPDVLADGGAAILARPGARLVDRGQVRTPLGVRGASVGGQRHSYLADWAVEIAEESTIGNPQVATFLEGLSFDALAFPTADGRNLLCEVRLDRSVLRGMRSVDTRHGPLECPSLAIERCRGSVVVPLGGTVVLFAAKSGDEVHAVLLSAAAE